MDIDSFIESQTEEEVRSHLKEMLKELELTKGLGNNAAGIWEIPISIFAAIHKWQTDTPTLQEKADATHIR